MSRKFIAAFFLGCCLAASSAHATVTISAATNGANISADIAANAVSPGWITNLGPIVIDEVNNANRDSFASGNGTLILKAPAGFEFNTSAPPNITFIAGHNITNATIVVTNPSLLTIILGVSGTSSIDQLTIGNSNRIQVRPVAGTPLASGQVFRPTGASGGTAGISGITTTANADGSGGSDFGTLSEAVGSASKFTFTTQPGAGSTGAPFGTQPVVITKDQFANNSTKGLAANVTVTASLSSGTGPLVGATNLNIGTAGGNGSVTYTNLQIDSAGTNKQLAASAPGFTNGFSAVFSVNGRPTISAIADMVTNEDNSTGPIPFVIDDAETPAASLILTIASSNTNLVTTNNIVFGGSGTNRTVNITPLTNQSGTATITITVSDGIVAASDAFVLTVNPANDAPTLNAIASLTINEDAGSTNVTLNGISSGAPNESQTLTVTATSSNTNLIANPTVTYTSSNTNGALSFAPLPNASGSATITVTIQDDGGTANGGTNTFTRNFVVTVQPVNDAPTLSTISNLAISLNAGQQTVNFGGITSGATNENQTLTVTATSGNTNIIPNPSITYVSPNTNGSLTFTPLTNASGSVVITVAVQDDGGTANGGTNSFSRQFTVNVVPQSDLAIIQQVNTNSAFLGGDFTFTLVVTNLGPSASTNITVTNILPSGVSLVSVVPSQGTFTTNDSISVTCNLGSLANGGVATVAVKVNPSVTGFITNTASVTSPVSDPNVANNASTASVNVVVQTNFVITAAAVVTESCANGYIDPAETVTVSLTLTNRGFATTSNLVATLKPFNGVTSPSGPQTYGVLTAGGPAVSRSFTFVPIGYCGGQFSVVLQLQDGANGLGSITNTLTFGRQVTNTWVYPDLNGIIIPTAGIATPYPSFPTVSGNPGVILKVTVTLTNVTHGEPDDLDLLLVSPTGQKVILMSDCGGQTGLNNRTLTFDDAAAVNLPDSAQITNGTYRPTDFQTTDTLPSPAPGRPYSTSLASFNGVSPNGDWQLFVNDDFSPFSGSIGGWYLTIQSRDPDCCVSSSAIEVSVNGSGSPDPVVVGNDLTYTLLASNSGPATATSVALTNPFPAGASFVSASTSQGTWINTGTEVRFNIGTLSAGATATNTLTLRPTIVGSITNICQAYGIQADFDLRNNIAVISNAVVVPDVSIVPSVSIVEGNTGTTNAVFVIQLSAPSSQTISVGYFATNDTAVAGIDYVSTSGTVTFAPGQTVTNIVVGIKGDLLNENSEYFTVTLTNPVNVAIADADSSCQIIDDDPIPSLSINDVSVAEGDSGTTNLIFSVTLSAASGQTVMVDYATTNGSAAPGVDYANTNGLLVFDPGVTSLPISVLVFGDSLPETSETLFARLTEPVNANISQVQGTGTIINDDLIPNIVTNGFALISENCAPNNGRIDPNETVTVSFSLRNIGVGIPSTTNLVATLLTVGGVVSPSAPQNYGALAANGATVSRSFTFTANGACGGSVIAVLDLRDGGLDLGMVTNVLTLGLTTTANYAFTNAAPITINQGGPASSYPADITVSGLSNPIIKVTVTLSNLSHSYPDDMDILLVGPGGEAVMLLSDVGSGFAVNNLTFTLDDAAANALPDNTQLVGGVFKPTNFDSPDAMNTPAPAEPYGTNLSVFNGLSANGTWSLYVFDDTGGDGGSISNGWRLNLTTFGTPICCGVGNSSADVAVTQISFPAIPQPGSNVTYTITVTNAGPDAAADVVLTNVMPVGAIFVSATNTSGVCINYDDILVCNLGLMTNKASAVITLIVAPTNATIITNAAFVSARTPDPNLANNTAISVLSVTPFIGVLATDATASEPGANTGQFTISRVGGAGGDLPVFYTVSGTAANGQDYTALLGSVIISNGNSSAIVSVSPLNDFLVEFAETVVLTLATNAAYAVDGDNGAATVTILDDDVQAIVISTSVLAVPEGGTAGYTVQLAAQPTSTVSVTSALTGGAGVLSASSGAVLTFTTNNWNVPQPVTIAAGVDANAVNDVGVFTVSAPGWTNAVVTATQIDQDTQTILVSTNAISVLEGSTSSYTVRLGAQPTNTTFVTNVLSGGSGILSVSSGAVLTFTTNNWNVPQPVVIAAALDSNAVNDSGVFTVSATGWTNTSVTATQLDDDQQTLIVSTNVLNVPEGSTNSYTVRLGAQPTNTVFVTSALTSGSSILSVSNGAVLTFTTNNWSVPQAVVIAAAADSNAVFESAVFVVSAAGWTNASVTATQLDDDFQTILASTSALNVPEGSTGSYTVRLGAQPTNTVVVTNTFTSGSSLLILSSGAVLTFTTNNWNVPQPVVIAAGTDANAVFETAVFTGSATGWTNATVTVTQLDFNTQTIVVSTNAISILEGSTNGYTVQLGAQPTNTLLVTNVLTSGSGIMSVSSGAVLTFTTNDWNVPQPVVIAAGVDSNAVYDIAVFTVRTTGWTNATVTATQLDDGLQTILVSTNAINVLEGSTNSYTVRLGAQPTNNVTVSNRLTSGSAVLSASLGSSLTFTTNNWNVPQTVVIAAAADSNAVSEVGVFTVSAPGWTNATVTATQLDDDFQTILVSTSVLDVPEGSTNAYTVRLSAQPTNTVFVTNALTSGSTILSVSNGAVLTFTTNNWNVPQPVVIMAAMDSNAVYESGVFIVSATGWTNATVTVTQLDDDVQTILVSTNALAVPEGGANSYTVRLGAQPANTVAVTNAFTSGSSILSLSDGAVLTFTTNDWNVPQPVVIAAGTDSNAVFETAVFTGSATGWTNATVTATQLDFNTQTIIVSTNAISILEGSTNGYTVQLGAQPTNTVLVTNLLTSGSGILSVSNGAVLTFTTDDWNVPQPVVIAAGVDSNAVNNVAVFTARTTGWTNATVTATQIDQDTQTILVSTNTINVLEGSTNSYTVRLGAQPTNNVTVSNRLTSGSAVLSVSSGAALTFTTNNWNVPQTVVLAAAADSNAVYEVAVFTVSAPSWTNTTVTATQLDDDFQTILVSTNAINVVEGSTNSYTVRLGAQPTITTFVTNTLTSGSSILSVSNGAVLTFTTNNWNVPQAVVIAAAVDVNLLNEVGVFTASANGWTNATVTATQRDQNTQTFIVSTNALNIIEGSTDAYTVRLSAQPTNTVLVTNALTSGSSILSVSDGAVLTFTTNDWDLPQAVIIVAGVDFDVFNDVAGFTVSAAGWTNATVTVTQRDQDTRTLLVSTNALAVPEDSTNSYLVRLSSLPTNTVFVTNAFFSGASILSVSNGAVLTFTTNDWYVPQAVTIASGVDGDMVDDSSVFTVKAPGWTNVIVAATQIDKDAPRVVVSTVTLDVPEGGTNSFTVKLSLPPTDTVFVTNTLTSGSGILSVVSGTVLTFTTNDWNVPQMVDIAAGTDANGVYDVAVFTLSADGWTNATVTATQLDQDLQTILVSTNAISVPEGGTNSYMVQLSVPPVGTVFVTNLLTVGSSIFSVSNGAVLAFTTNNWNVPQPVVIAAGMDSNAVNEIGVFTVKAVGWTNATVTATQLDDDFQTILVSTNAINVIEGSTNNYTVRLGAQPTNSVFVTSLLTAGSSILSVSNGAVLTFTSNNWNVPQSVVIAAGVDFNTLNETGVFTVSAPGWTNAAVTATQLDGDQQTLIVSTNTLNVAEGSTNTYTVRLGAQPTNNVTVSNRLASGSAILSVSSGSSLAFTTNNWNVPQTVVIAAGMDSNAVNDVAVFAVSAPGWTNATVSATQLDDDQQTLLVSTAALNVPEGSTNAYTVRLGAQPTNTVSVTNVFTSGSSVLSVSNGAVLTFTTNNWNVPQTVVIAAGMDSNAVNDVAVFTVSAPDWTNVTVTATQLDDDQQLLIVSTNALNAPEGSTNSYTVRLGAQPTNSVTVSNRLTSGSAILNVSSGSALTFTTNNWNVPQPVVVASAMDSNALNDVGVFTVSAPGWTNATVTATQLDDDQQTLIVSTNALTVPEGSTNAYTVRLGAQPTNSVTVSNRLTSGSVILSVNNGSALTFTTNNWNVPQAVVIAAGMDSNAVNEVAVFTVSAPGWTNATVTVAQSDDDQQTIIVSASAINVPEGSTTTYTVRLGAQPTNSVTVSNRLTSGSAILSVSSGSSLTFTTNNWNVPQTVQIAAGVDANAVNDVGIFTVSAVGWTNATVTATQIDQDALTILVSTSAINVPEGGTNGYTVRLSAQPIATVSVTNFLSSVSSILSVSTGAALTFTTNNWNVAQPVVITAGVDATAVNDVGVFTVSAAGWTNATVTATQLDQDTQTIITSTNTLNVMEGSTNSFTVRLGAQPTNTVLVTNFLSSGSSILSVGNGAVLAFTTNNWNVPQTVVIAAGVDVNITNETGIFSVIAAGWTNTSVVATQLDQDVLGLVVSVSAIAVPEGGTNSYTVRLSAQPTNTVAVTNQFTSGDNNLSVINGAELVFTPADWSVPQIVTLAAAVDGDGVNDQALFTVSSAGLTNVLVTATQLDADAQYLVVSLDTNYLASAVYSDIDVAQFIAAAGLTNPIEQTAVFQLVAQAKAHGWWNLMDAIYPMVGGNSNSTAINLRSPAQYNIVWFGTNTFTMAGVQGDGVSGFGFTGIRPATAGRFGNDSASLFYYSGTSNPPFGAMIGADEVQSSTLCRNGFLSVGDGTVRFEGLNSSYYVQSMLAPTNWIAPIMFSRTNAHSEFAAYDGVTMAVANEGAATNTCLSTTAIAINGRGWEQGEVSPTVDYPSTMLCQGATVGAGVPFQIWTLMRQDWRNFQAMLGRSAEAYVLSDLPVPEGGTNGFQVALAAQPTNTVFVTNAWSGGAGVLSVGSGAVLTFTTNNWNIPQSVRIISGADANTVNDTAGFTVSSPGLTNVAVLATQIDTNVLQLVVSTNALAVPEDGTNTLTVVLNAQPSVSVVVTNQFASGDVDLSVVGGTVLTFTTNNWNVPQTVTFAAAVDADALNGQAAFSVSSLGLAGVQVIATEIDADSQYLVVSTNVLGVPEGWINNFLVNLAAQPASDVVVTLARTSGDTDLVLTGDPVIVFTTNNWNVPQSVVVAALADLDALNGQAIFTLSAAGFTNATVTAVEEDVNQQVLVVSTAAINVPEGSTNGFTVQLGAQPGNTVFVTSTLTSGSTILSVSNGAVLTFTTNNWNVPQPVIIAARADSNAVNDVAAFTVSTPGWTNATVTATQLDVNTQTLIVSTNVLNVLEGSTNAFTVRLGAQPTSSVLVTNTRTSGSAILSVSSGASLTFTTNNWNVPQPVVIASAMDSNAVNDAGVFTVSVPGWTNATVTATQLDDDQQTLIVSTNAINVPEGGTNIYTVRLGAQPTNNITVSNRLASGSAILSVSSGASLTFTTNNWNVPQPVVIASAMDSNAVNDAGVFTVSAPGWTNATVTATQLDVNTQTLIISTNAINVPEGGTSIYIVRLGAQPTNSVTVSNRLTSGSAILSVSGGASLTFTTNNWNVAQTVVIAAGVDANAVNEVGVFTVSAPGWTNATVAVTQLDQDTQSIIVSTNSLNVPEGTTNAFTVRLSAQPANDVVVTVARAGGDGDLGVAGGSNLVFTVGNWDQAQGVAIGAAEDADAVNGQAVFSVSAAGLATTNVTAVEVDNDNLGLVVETPVIEAVVTGIQVSGNDVLVSFATESNGLYRVERSVNLAGGLWTTVVDNVVGTGQVMQVGDIGGAGQAGVFYRVRDLKAEAQHGMKVPEGQTKTFTVRLSAQPANDVVVTVARAGGDGDLSVAGGSNLVFTVGNWNQAQGVGIAAAEDADAVNGQAVFSVSAAGLATTNVTAVEVDNDNLGLVVETPVIEAVVTGIQVSGNDVLVSFATESNGLYRVERSVNLAGGLWTTVVDNVVGTGQVMQVGDIGGAGQAGVFYRVRDLKAEAQHGMKVPEGQTKTFTVRLSAQPANDVVVTVARAGGDGDLGVAGGSNLVFTVGNWDQAQGVGIAAAEDADAVNGQAVFNVSAAGLATTNVTAVEVDNDNLGLVVETPVIEAVVTGIQVSGNDVLVSFATESNGLYRVERSVNLAGGLWTTVVDNVVGTGQVMQVGDIGGAGQAGVFYRVRDLKAEAQHGMKVPEGQTKTFTVRLSAQPANDVVVTVARAGGDGDLGVAGGSNLVFTVGNWDQAQGVGIAAAEDADAVNGQAVFNVSAAGLATTNVTAVEVDNDNLGLVVETPVIEAVVTGIQVSGNDVLVSFATESNGLYRVERSVNLAGGLWTTVVDNVVGTGQVMQVGDIGGAGQAGVFYRVRDLKAEAQHGMKVPEGQTKTFTVRLSAQPANDVVVTVARAGGDGDLGVAGGSNLVFTVGNWDQAQGVGIAAAEDADAVNGQAVFNVSAAGLATTNVTAVEVDNDVPGLVLATPGLEPRITDIEVLNGDVLISFETESGALYRLEKSPSLSGGVWTTIADSLPGDGQAFSVLDVGGSGQPSAFYRIRLLSPGPQNLMGVAEGRTNSFNVRLSSQPADNVAVSVARINGDADLSVAAGSTLVFTPADWNVFQLVNIFAAPDADTTNGAAVFGISAAGTATQNVTARELDNGSH